jgi:hypothetical protein
MIRGRSCCKQLRDVTEKTPLRARSVSVGSRPLCRSHDRREHRSFRDLSGFEHEEILPAVKLRDESASAFFLRRAGPRSGPLARGVLFGYHSPAMLSRAQEARVREILGSHAPGTLLAYCLEHLAATAEIPPAHLADLAAFVRNLRACGACHTDFGGICEAGRHATARLLISGRTIPPRQEALHVS